VAFLASSARFKEAIKPMDKAIEAILALVADFFYHLRARAMDVFSRSCRQ
jgi:hypothetical protein